MNEWGEGGCVHLLVALCSISKAYKSVVSIAQNVCTNQPCTVCVFEWCTKGRGGQGLSVAHPRLTIKRKASTMVGIQL